MKVGARSNLLMRAAIERREARPDRAPAHRADVALDRDAAFGELEIRTGAASFVSLRPVLIVSSGLCQFLLLLGLVFLPLCSTGAATDRGCSGNAHRFDESSPRRSGSRHCSPPTHVSSMIPKVRGP